MVYIPLIHGILYTMNKANSINVVSPRTGIAVPLGALVTDRNTPVGEFPDLVPLAEFCKKAGLEIIQLLPVNDTGTQSSPYNGLSAFALHPLYISIQDIPGFDRVLADDESFAKNYHIYMTAHAKDRRFNYAGLLQQKTALLETLYRAFPEGTDAAADKALADWIAKNLWVKSYAVFKHLKYVYMQASWKSWPKKDRIVTADDITARWNDPELHPKHLFYAWMQMTAHNQFLQAARAVQAMGIILKGDIPIMMNEDSCDSWSEPGIFNHTLRAGSPPDATNPSGQSWGFPTYQWNNLQKDGYRWWKARLITASDYYQAYRLDHILGFFRIWAVPEGDCSAVLGHPEPCKPITRAQLVKAGFDNGRIRWLSEPHIPTGVIEDITWNHDAAVRILSLAADRIGSEELWNFKPTVQGDRELYALDLTGLCTEDAAVRIKKLLADYWNNRTLIPLAVSRTPGKECTKFLPAWYYTSSISWKSLSQEEQQSLEKLFVKNSTQQLELWKAHAQELLPELTKSVPMVPCGEDLGVGLACVPGVLKENGILGLRVVRWERRWEAPEQPFIDFSDYDALSVTTTSVHDSPTLRQWWEDEPEASALFKKAFKENFPRTRGSRTKSAAQAADTGTVITADSFSPAIAESVLTAAAGSASMWCIHPLQDFLYLQKKYWLKDKSQERINIPGTVSDFNWTYRMPVSISRLMTDDTIIEKIAHISKLHKDSAGGVQ